MGYCTKLNICEWSSQENFVIKRNTRIAYFFELKKYFYNLTHISKLHHLNVHLTKFSKMLVAFENLPVWRNSYQYLYVSLWEIKSLWKFQQSEFYTNLSSYSKYESHEKIILFSFILAVFIRKVWKVENWFCF